MDISIVIPAYNEEKFISKTIESIYLFLPDMYTFEIIVVDHGSIDKTVELATTLGANVVNGEKAPTIAALRNIGVNNSSGKMLFFIDADVTFTPQWSENISKVVENLRVNPYQVCGSLPKIPRNSPILMKCWFDPKSSYEKPKYIGSGHLITSRVLFNKVMGFPEGLETGEDFNFCMNATRSGASIVAFPELSVLHNGSPGSLLKFAEREVWHGRGDWANLNTLFSSKVALLTLAFLMAHLSLIPVLLLNFNLSIIIVPILIICLVSSIIKFSTFGFKIVALNSFTFYIYYFARTLSLFSALLTKKINKRERSS